MNKAFVKEDNEREEEFDDIEEVSLPQGAKNYMTPEGFSHLQGELKQLVEVERPEVVNVVSWAAGNGDRSENGDYIYGKKRLREIDRRIRYLHQRLAAAEVVNVLDHEGDEQIFFGATVTVLNEAGKEKKYRIVGLDEANAAEGDISWISPLAKALLGKTLGDEAIVKLPDGLEELEIIEVKYSP